MTTLVHVPRGRKSPEHGLVYLYARYLREQGLSVSQLRCNGVFSSCLRDEDPSRMRPFDHCFRCTSEQAALARWADLTVFELSRMLSPELIESTRRWIESCERAGLPTASVGARSSSSGSVTPILPFELSRGLLARLGVPDVDGISSREELVRRTMLSALRAAFAMRTVVAQVQPALILAAFDDDYLFESLQGAAAEAGIPLVVFAWDSEAREIGIGVAGTRSGFSTPLLFEDVTELRAGTATWPREVHEVMALISRLVDTAVSQPVSSVEARA